MAILAGALLLSGCGEVSARVRGVAPLNLNDNSESTPVKVRFYQLANADSFQAATFESLWVNDKEPLGKDRLADPVVVTVLPGGSGDAPQVVPLGALDVKTHFIGVMGLYRKSAPDESRILVIPADQIGDRIIELTGYGISRVGDSGKPAAAEAPPSGQADTGTSGSASPGPKGGRAASGR